MKVKDFLEQINGKILTGTTETEFCKFYRDSRLVEKGSTYIALVGENYDGNDFATEAIKKGAKLCIISKEKNNVLETAKENNATLILVSDTLEALQQIAKYKRNLYKIPTIAVTGSVGKTSTKDLIASVLSSKYKTLKTQGNMNNFLGVPLTILNLNNEEAMVVEIGMNHFGEISKLTNIVKPTISVITNIGTAHIGNLGSRENILKAKLEILEGMEKKILVINNDNDLLNKFYMENKNKIKIYTYGIKNKSDVMAKNISLNENYSKFICEINIDNENKNETNRFEIVVPVGGIHFVYNAICAVIVAKLLNLNNEEINEGIKQFKPTKNRMDITKLKNGVTIINDSYNASLDSMKMLLQYLKNYNSKRKIAVLGDMLELGKYSQKLHEEVGKEVAEDKIDKLILLGENSKYIEKNAIKNGMKKENIFYFKSREEIYNFIKLNWKEGDCILFKASNGMKFFEIADKLIKEEKI